MTNDQLTYIIERTYPNVKIGIEVIVACSVSMENNKIIHNNDAFIVTWLTNEYQKPDQDTINDLWEKMKNQYDSDPDRLDSKMHSIIIG